RRSGTECSSDTRHDDIRNAVLGEHFDLFTTTSKDERIAALQTRNAQTALRVAHEQLVNARLGLVMIAACFLANEHTLRISPCAFEYGVRDQPVIQNDVGLLQQLHGAQREQIRIAGASADQIYLAETGSVRRR